MPRTAHHDKLADAVVTEAAPVVSALKAIRLAKGYSVEHLALTCGLATNEIMDIESGKDADPMKLRRIAFALQLPESALISAAVTPAGEDRSAA